MRPLMPTWCRTLRAYNEHLVSDVVDCDIMKCHFCHKSDASVQVCPVCRLAAHSHCTAPWRGSVGGVGDDDCEDDVARPTLNQWKGAGGCLERALNRAAKAASGGVMTSLFAPLQSVVVDVSQHLGVCDLCWPVLLEAQEPLPQPPPLPPPPGDDHPSPVVAEATTVEIVGGQLTTSP